MIFLLDILAEQLKGLSQESATPSSLAKLVQNSFGIQLTTECECCNCHTKTQRSDINFYLPLSFDEVTSDEEASRDDTKAPKSLQHLIDNFFRAESLSAETGNSYACSQCASLQSAKKHMFITRDESNRVSPPEYLIFTLNRFIYNGSSSSNNNNNPQNTKIMSQLDYPGQIMVDTRLHDGERVSETYSMCAMVVHSGASLHYGHYYSYVTHSEQDKCEWLLANDSQISETTFESLLANLKLFKDDTPYVLFYKRVHVDESSVSQMEVDGSVALPQPAPDVGISVHNQKLVETIQQDNQMCELEERARLVKKQSKKAASEASLGKYGTRSPQRKDDDDSDENSRLSHMDSLYNNAQQDTGPRVIF